MGRPTRPGDGYQLYLAADAVRRRRGLSSPLLRRRMQRALALALRDHATGREQLPEEIAAEIARAFEDALQGNRPAIFEPIPTRGRPGMTTRHRECIADAVRYVQAARLGRIQDRTARKTVLNAFGHNGGKSPSTISAKTLEEWLGRAGADDPKARTMSALRIEALMRASGRTWQAHISMWARQSIRLKPPTSTG